MFAIVNLPTEVYLQVLSYLFIPEIVSFQLVCKQFNAVVQENLQDVYRGAAILHRYISSNPLPDTIEEVIEDQRDVFRDGYVACWKVLCHIRWKLDIAWKRPVFPNESHVHAGLGGSFLRICHDDPYLLVPRESQGGFDVIHLDETRGSESRGSLLYPQGDLQLSSQGYLIFKMTKRRFDVWRREADWTEPTTVVDASPQKSVVRYVGTFELDGRCVTQKMRGDCLMMVTEQNVLSIFNFDPILIAAAAGGDTSSERNEIPPTSKTDISLIGNTNNGGDSQHEVAYTTSIDFDEECIFHCTTQGFRILSRSTFEQLYIIVNTEWKRAALKKWVKCFTANVFYIPRKPVSVPSEDDAEAEAKRPEGEKEEEEGDIVLIQRGASESRKSQEWRWDVMSVHVEGGMVVMSFPGGWIVGLPDYRGLLSGERTLHDGFGCWVLDIGSSCTGMVFDGRRIVCTERNRHVIVNLHDIPGRALTEQTRVVRLERREWIPVGTMQSMMLNDWSLCFLAARSDEEMSSVTVVKWSFRE